MKRLLFLFLLLSAPASADNLQLGLETAWRTTATDPQPKIATNLNLLFDRQFKEKSVGLWGFGQIIPDGWAEFYAGIAVFPNQSCDFGFAVGLEQAENPWRIGVYAYCQHRMVSILGPVEYGGSGGWWHSEANVSPVPWFDIGIMARDGHGVGGKARLLFKVNGVKMAAYIAVLAEFTTLRPMGLAAIQLWPIGE